MKRNKGNGASGGHLDISRARRMALQATYQWIITGDEPATIAEQFLTENPSQSFDKDYFRTLFLNAIDGQAEIFTQVEKWLDRPLVQVDPVEKSVLQISCYEMKANTNVPYKVIINEAVELAKTFGAEESHKYINALLDKAANTWRQAEIVSSGR